MKKYEVVYIFRSALEPETIESRLEDFHGRLTSPDGAEITAVEHWGKRQLAYEIQDETNGYYVVAQFRTEPSALPDFEAALKLEEDLLRHLVVISEGELPTPPSLRGEDEEEEDEDEDEADEDEDEEDEDEEEEESEEEDEVEEDEEDEDDEEEEEEED